MKRCPECRRDYYDDTLLYCLDDGSALLEGPGLIDEPATLKLFGAASPKPAKALPAQDDPSPAASVAVLPFANTSADAENEYFCDGLAEELLNALAKIGGLKVAARTSAFAFKGKNANAGDIARTLGVKSLLEGSVRKAGDRLRITVQLINASDGYQVWSERYDREMRDIFDVQDEITLAVVDALKIELLGKEKDAVLRRYTDNTKAYELYLQGRYHYHKYTPDGWRKAIELFERTIAEEPNYAPAHAKLSASIAFCWFFGVLSSADAIEPWKAAAHRALELDERMEDAYESLGRQQFYYDRNWSEGERSLRRGIEINPRNSELHAQLGLCLVVLGRFEEATSEAAIALELDPLSMIVNIHVGWLYMFAGRVDDAVALMKKTIETEPTLFNAHFQLGVGLMMKHEFEDALEAFQTSWTLGNFHTTLSNLGASCFALGRKKEASEVLENLLELERHEPVAAVDIARLLSAMGETDRVFDWLDKAVEERNGALIFLRSRASGFTAKTRHDPRFASVCERLGLPEWVNNEL